MASGFSLRSMVGAPRERESVPRGEPAGEEDALREDDELGGRSASLADVIGAGAQSSTTRVESEVPIRGVSSRPFLRYSDSAAHLPGRRSPTVTVGSGSYDAGPSADDVQREFERMEARFGDGDRQASGDGGSLRAKASQIVSSGDFGVGAPDAPAPLNRGPSVLRYSGESMNARPRHLASSSGNFAAPNPTLFSAAQPVDDYAARRQPGADDEGYDSPPQWDEDGAAEDRQEPYTREPDDDEPIVPPELLRDADKPVQWEDHPAHHVVMALLEKRGVIPSQFPELVNYHMAPAFLDFLAIVMSGSYFVKYGHKGTAPKERFVRLRILSDDVGRPVPSLTITIHRDGVQLVDRIRLEDLVGISRGVDGPAFRRHLVHYDVIKGSYVGQHRSRVSTKGAFSLWFYDKRTRSPKSLDLLTTNLNVFEVWVRAMEGVLSVNSVCIHRSNVAQEMQRLFKLAQKVLDDGEDY